MRRFLVSIIIISALFSARALPQSKDSLDLVKNNAVFILIKLDDKIIELGINYNRVTNLCYKILAANDLKMNLLNEIDSFKTSHLQIELSANQSLYSITFNVVKAMKIEVNGAQRYKTGLAMNNDWLGFHSNASKPILDRLERELDNFIKYKILNLPPPPPIY